MPRSRSISASTRSSELISRPAKLPFAPGASNRTRKSSRLLRRARNERRGASRSPRRVQIVPSQAEQSARTVRSVASRTHGSFGPFESKLQRQTEVNDVKRAVVSPLRRREDKKIGRREASRGGLRAKPTPKTSSLPIFRSSRQPRSAIDLGDVINREPSTRALRRLTTNDQSPTTKTAARRSSRAAPSAAVPRGRRRAGS
jgi:hypothetical protein